MRILLDTETKGLVEINKQTDLSLVNSLIDQLQCEAGRLQQLKYKYAKMGKYKRAARYKRENLYVLDVIAKVESATGKRGGLGFDIGLVQRFRVPRYDTMIGTFMEMASIDRPTSLKELTKKYMGAESLELEDFLKRPERKCTEC